MADTINVNRAEIDLLNKEILVRNLIWRTRCGPNTFLETGYIWNKINATTFRATIIDDDPPTTPSTGTVWDFVLTKLLAIGVGNGDEYSYNLDVYKDAILTVSIPQQETPTTGGNASENTRSTGVEELYQEAENTFYDNKCALSDANKLILRLPNCNDYDE